MDDRWLSVDEIAEYLGVSAHSADRDRRDRCIVITALGAS
jgi:hypothetical protein